MASCCPHPSNTESTSKFFSKRSKSYARTFRKGKLEKLQEFLIDEISKSAIEGQTVLDIGCGVGKLHLTLLRRGAISAIGIDMSQSMIDHAKTFAQKFNVAEKTSYLLGDFMDLADSLPTADITLLDKVICCYEDLEGLVTVSAGKTNQVYALIFPADNIFIRLLFKTQIAVIELFHLGFRPYWHRWKRVHELLFQRGFTLVNTRSAFVWQAAVYRKTTSSSS